MKGNKYVEIDREMSKAFRDFESIPTESITVLPTSNADVPAQYTLVPGMYSSFREEYLKEITARAGVRLVTDHAPPRLEAANRRRERKMGGRK